MMRTVSNGGHQDSRLTGMFPGFFCVWLNPYSLLNILLMSDVTDHFRVTMYLNVDNAIYVHMDAEKVLRFKKIRRGLYMLSANEKNNSYEKHSIPKKSVEIIE